jgi:hypothetical protein
VTSLTEGHYSRAMRIPSMVALGLMLLAAAAVGLVLIMLAPGDVGATGSKLLLVDHTVGTAGGLAIALGMMTRAEEPGEVALRVAYLAGGIVMAALIMLRI